VRLRELVLSSIGQDLGTGYPGEVLERRGAYRRRHHGLVRAAAFSQAVAEVLVPLLAAYATS
jgi:hypothetical protein